MRGQEKIGIVKEIDGLGRLQIPKEIRLLFKMEKAVELVITSEGILIRSPLYRLVKKTPKNRSSTYRINKAGEAIYIIASPAHFY